MRRCTRCGKHSFITGHASTTTRWTGACSPTKRTKPCQRRWHKRCWPNAIKPGKASSRRAQPKYKHKTEGRNILVYTIQAISRGKKGLKRGIIKPSMLPIEVKTEQDPEQIDQVRIIPRNGHYVVEVVYS